MSTKTFLLLMGTVSSSDKLIRVQQRGNSSIAATRIIPHISIARCCLQCTFTTSLYKPVRWNETGPGELNDIARVSVQDQGKASPLNCGFTSSGNLWITLQVLRGNAMKVRVTCLSWCFTWLESCSYPGRQAKQVLNAHFRDKESEAKGGKGTCPVMCTK